MKRIKMAFIVACLPLAPAKINAEEASPRLEKAELSSYTEFVKKVGDQIVDLFSDKKNSMTKRKQVFQSILENYFSINAIGKFVLARYWRQASEAEQNEYVKVFKKALIENYSSHFDNYHNERLEILGARQTSDKGVIVQTRVVRPGGGEPLNVDWKVFKVQGGMKVFDLIVNGASMSISLRTEYASLIQSNGGTVRGLVQALQKKYT